MRSGRSPRLGRFSKDRADPDIGVLQIRRGVSLQRQHLVPGKNVIGHPILREIGIFDRADADHVARCRSSPLRSSPDFFPR